MNSNFTITLAPNFFDLRPKTFKLPEKTFRLAVSLVERQGFRTNLLGAIANNDIAPFAEHLSRALKNEIEDEDRQALERLLSYLTGDGARSRGLAINRGW